MKLRDDRMRRIYTFLFLALFLMIPTPAFAAESDKWYMKPFEFMMGKFFEYILTPFVGIHEPAYYIFYQGDGLIWGLYTQEQFDNAIQTGFNMMLFIVSFMLVTSLIKMGTQSAYGKFSASMRVDLLDNGFKVIIALLLLFQFFPIINIFFKLNMYGVSLFETGVSNPTSLKDLGADILTSYDATSPGEEITFTDLDNEGNNPIKNYIISFFSLGVSLWFKAYYIQRIFVISGLIILAPIWISTMFFPKLQGITNTAFKELWAQIMSQVIHAAVFFLYFWLFDGLDKFSDWFTYIIALSLFIPVSESIRFAMGATSENAGRLATIGTLAGAGALTHMGKAAGDIKSGIKDSFAERKGAFDGQKGASNGKGASLTGFSKEGGDRQYGGTANLNGSPNKFARNMRSFGHVAGGLGSAMMRTGGFAAGMGINPIAGHIAAEGGSEVGKKAGYGAGVVSYAGGKGIQGKARNAKQGFQDNYQSSKEQGQGGFQATISGIGGGIKEGTMSSDFKNNPIRRNEVTQKAGGAVGEAVFGRGIGYQMGAEGATMFGGKGVENVDLAELNTKQTYAIVTSNKGSYLAKKGENNKLIPKTNMKAGDPSLSDGQMVVQE